MPSGRRRGFARISLHRPTASACPTTQTDSDPLCKRGAVARSSVETKQDSSMGIVSPMIPLHSQLPWAPTSRHSHSAIAKFRHRDFFSLVPPNHAATRPLLPSTMVEACIARTELSQKWNSAFTIPVSAPITRIPQAPDPPLLLMRPPGNRTLS